MKYKLGMCSGGFDPVHIGHVRYIKAAMKLCNKLVVVVNSDKWLRLKKGYALMTAQDRAEIIKAMLRLGDEVVVQKGHKKTVANELLSIKPNAFFKGGDRVLGTLPKNEIETCTMLGCDIVVNVGGEKIQSSQSLINKAKTC